MITKVIEHSGNLTNSSGNGKVTIDQTTGNIIIRNGVDRVIEIDSDGFKYYDDSGVERISMGQDSAGRQQIIVYGADGKAQIIVGQDPKDDSPVVAVSESGADVREELLNGTAG